MLRVLGFLAFATAVQTGERGTLLDGQDFDGEVGIKATVGGKEKGFALMPFWPHSYLDGGSGAVTAIVSGGKTLLRVPLEKLEKDELPEDADGVLGQDALRKATFVFDPIRETVTILPETKITQARAEEILKELPEWGGPRKIVKISLTRTPDGVPILDSRIGDHKCLLMLRLSFYDSFLDSSVPRAKEVVSDRDWSYLGKANLGGFETLWMPYAPRDDWGSKEDREGAGGMVAVDAFRSRRVVVDLAGGAVYVEALTPDAQRSLWLKGEMAMPFLVENGKILIGSVPGEAMEYEEEMPIGAQVLSIDGSSAESWIKDLSASDSEVGARIAKRILRLDHDFDMLIRNPDGTEETIRVPRDDRPEPAASLRVGARVRAALRSR